MLAQAKFATRLAALIAIGALLALLGPAAIASPAAAAPRSIPPPGSRLPTPPRIETEELEEVEEEELEEAEGEEAEGEAGPRSLAPAQCMLRSATASVLASSSRDTVRLTVSYRAYAPSRLKLDFWLKGSRGALQLGQASERLSERGSLHQNAHLSDAEMEKVNAARAFIVHFDVAGAPAFCSRYATRRLTVRQILDGQSSWFSAAASAGENN